MGSIFPSNIVIKALVAPLPVQLPSTVRVAFRPVTALRASDALLLSPPVGLQHWFFYVFLVLSCCHVGMSHVC